MTICTLIPNNILVFAENHDNTFRTKFIKTISKKYKMAMALLATVRGIPQLYYGSEIGMSGNKGLMQYSLDFPGGWKTDPTTAFIPQGRSQLQAENFDFTAKLFQWRKNSKAVHFCKMTHYIPETTCILF
jgi:glycosidase